MMAVANNRPRRATNTVLHLFIALILPSAVKAQSASHWNTLGEEALENALNIEMNTNRAKNIILFLGDGMDIITTTASRIHKGQLDGRSGEEGSLFWESFPYVALAKTYNTDYQVPDSAGTATAFLSGVKTKFQVIGYDDTIETSVCASAASAESLRSIVDDAVEEGKLAGIVSTARMTHATNAAGYAHSPDRNWESDKDLTDEAKENGCIDIASQLINYNVDLRVTMGGGRRAFLPANLTDPEYPDKTGNRKDGRNLTDEWLATRTVANLRAKYVWNLGDFNAVDPDTSDALLGLFEPSHMQYEKNRVTTDDGEPSIAEMTEKAIEILSKDEDGYFLLVEGGRIDHGHHEGIAHSALTETLALEAAVEKALEMVDTDETLVIVTADHGHVMSMAGYPSRGNPILGLSDVIMGEDGLPYTTLGYQNGYGFRRVNQSFYETGMRPNLTSVDTEDPSFLQDALVPLYETVEETHGGQDVAIYATGPLAHLFHGVQEQNYIAHVMRYASCLGKNKDHCNSGSRTQLTSLMLFMSTCIALSFH